MPDPAAHQSVGSHPRGSTLSITVIPRSAINDIDVRADGQVRARITAPPVDGAANARLLKLLADTLGLPRTRISMLSGDSSRQKRLLVEGIEPADLAERLLRKNR